MWYYCVVIKISHTCVLNTFFHSFLMCTRVYLYFTRQNLKSITYENLWLWYWKSQSWPNSFFNLRKLCFQTRVICLACFIKTCAVIKISHACVLNSLVSLVSCVYCVYLNFTRQILKSITYENLWLWYWKSQSWLNSFFTYGNCVFTRVWYVWHVSLKLVR